ncbi:hypothetical protein YC2023_060788 [Brassica napus]
MVSLPPPFAQEHLSHYYRTLSEKQQQERPRIVLCFLFIIKARKGHPNHKFLRYDSSEQFDDLKIIFECATANVSSAIGLGDTTDARVFTVGDSQVQDNLNFEDINDDVYAQQSSPENGVKRRVEKLSTFEEEQQMYDEMQANQMEEDESDLDILLVMLNNIATTYVRTDSRKQRM